MTVVDRIAVLGESVSEMSEAELARAVGVSRERIRQVKGRLKHQPKNRRDETAAGYGSVDRRVFLSAMTVDFDRFTLYLEEGGSDECWLWTGAKTPLGYGVFSRHNRYAHRIAYERAYGSIPDDMGVCHHCDTPSCVNPRHLFPGTHKDNTWDSLRKHRFKPFGRPISKDLLSLTRKKVLEIRDAYNSLPQVVINVRRGMEVTGVPRGSAKELAQRFGIARRLVTAIARQNAGSWI